MQLLFDQWPACLNVPRFTSHLSPLPTYHMCTAAYLVSFFTPQEGKAVSSNPKVRLLMDVPRSETSVGHPTLPPWGTPLSPHPSPTVPHT